MRSVARLLVLLSAVSIAAVLPPQAAVGGDPTHMSPMDISFLWPLPESATDLAGLIAADAKIGGAGELWPQSLFERVLQTAADTGVVASSGQVLHIRLSDPAFHDRATWKVAGIRIDPSAPSCDEAMIRRVGSIPQVRLVLQPVTARDGVVTVHDFTAHLAFDFLKSPPAAGPGGAVIPAVPDREAFGAIVNDLVALKIALNGQGIATDGPLGVHPGLAAPGTTLREGIRTLLTRHLTEDRLHHVAFMGVRRPEPWIFLLMSRGSTDFDLVPQRAAGGAPALMFFKPDPKRVLPEPNTTTFGSVGVSTADLLRNPPNLDALALESPPPGFDRAPKLREIPDIIANPKLSHLLNSDCVSCHTESALRTSRSLEPAGEEFAYRPPAGFPGVDLQLLPRDLWNVRNFGWGVGTSGKRPTVTMRTAHEAAEAAAFINREYLAPATVRAVSSPLNLVMTAKSDDHYQQLKEKITSLQALPPAQNPIVRALEGLGVVHDARFVFLPHNQLAVITTYDGDFDEYIDLFVDEIGDVFNVILPHIADAPAGRVQDEREAFRRFVREHDIAPAGQMYSAYPDLTVQAIRALRRQDRDSPQ